MFTTAIAAATLAVSLSVGGQTGQEQDPAPIQLEDVTVTGRSLEGMIRNFVTEVAEPNRGRGLARWDGQVCVGAVNLRIETAQYLVDRISTIAGDLGVETGAPGCDPNLLVIATTDANALTAALSTASPRSFRMGGAGMDRGRTAFHEFQNADRPVRWWQLSMPVDSQSGLRVARLPGECDLEACVPPSYNVAIASRLKTQVVNNLFRSIVVVDVDQVSQLTVLQLADYVAMVSLAQIDPDADTSAYASILNVFDDPAASASLTDWDSAYLGGLYAAQRNDTNLRANRGEISRAIHREHDRLRALSDPLEER